MELLARTWSDETEIDGEGFVDPFLEDRADYFFVQEDGKISALKSPARYIIALLNLNRPTPVQRRKARILSSELLPLLLNDIIRLEMKTDLSSEEEQELYLKKMSLELTSIQLDFSLK